MNTVHCSNIIRCNKFMQEKLKGRQANISELRYLRLPEYSVVIKNGDMKQCRNYRTIALVSHASKIMLKIILERIRGRTESELSDAQAGFRRGKGTRDQVTNLRIIMEKMREH